MMFSNLILASLLASGMATGNEESHLRRQKFEESHPRRLPGRNRRDLRDQVIGTPIDGDAPPRGPNMTATENKAALNDVYKTVSETKKDSTAEKTPTTHRDKPPKIHKQHDEVEGMQTQDFLDCGPYMYDLFVKYEPDWYPWETQIKIWNEIDGYIYTEYMDWCWYPPCHFNICVYYNEQNYIDIVDLFGDGMLSGYVYADAYDGWWNFLGVICDLDTSSELNGIGYFKEIPFKYYN